MSDDFEEYFPPSVRHRKARRATSRAGQSVAQRNRPEAKTAPESTDERPTHWYKGRAVRKGWASQLAKKNAKEYSDKERLFKKFAGRKHHEDLESRPFEWYSEHLLTVCTVKEANEIWCKAQDSVKHKYQRIMKHNPKHVKITSFDRQLARNAELDRRLEMHIKIHREGLDPKEVACMYHSTSLQVPLSLSQGEASCATETSGEEDSVEDEAARVSDEEPDQTEPPSIGRVSPPLSPALPIHIKVNSRSDQSSNRDARVCADTSPEASSMVIENAVADNSVDFLADESARPSKRIKANKDTDDHSSSSGSWLPSAFPPAPLSSLLPMDIVKEHTFNDMDDFELIHDLIGLDEDPHLGAPSPVCSGEITQSGRQEDKTATESKITDSATDGSPNCVLDLPRRLADAESLEEE